MASERHAHPPRIAGQPRLPPKVGTACDVNDIPRLGYVAHE
jgi:hypothetical protein